MKKILLFCIMISSFTMAQIGIGTPSPNSSAIIHIESNSKGFLPPRLNNTQRAALDTKGAIEGPANGLMIYNTDEDCLQMNLGNQTNPEWKCLGTSPPVIAIACNPVNFTATNNNAITVNTNASIRLETSGHSPSANTLNWAWTVLSQETGATTILTPVGNNANADFSADTPGSYQVRVTAQNTTVPSTCNVNSSLDRTYDITVNTVPPCNNVTFTINTSNLSAQSNSALRLITNNHSPNASSLNWSWAIASQVSGATASIVPVGNNSRADFTANLPGTYTVTVTGENTSVPSPSCGPTSRTQTFTIVVSPSFMANVSLSSCSVSGGSNNYNVCAGNFNSVTPTVNTGSYSGSLIGPGTWTYNGNPINYNTFRCPYTGNYTLFYDMYATVTGSGSARMPNINQLNNGNPNEQAILNRVYNFSCTSGQVPPQNGGGLNPVNQAGGDGNSLNGSASSRFENVRIEYNGTN